MKKTFKVLLLVYSLLFLFLYLKLLPDPSKFLLTRDIILARRECGFWQLSFIPFESYFHISENFPANLWLILGHFLGAFVWGILLSLSFKKLSIKKYVMYSLIFFAIIEIIQFVTAAGVFDIDTIIQHTVGALVGVMTVVIINKNREEQS